MPITAPALLRWQFDLTWSLFAYHLDRLEPDDFLGEPAALCWTMRRDADGAWRPDWADTEPDPIPAPTIAWLTWHLGWWWLVAGDHLVGRPARRREDVVWPGPGEETITWLRGLRMAWTDELDRLTVDDLARPAAFPWSADAGLTVAHMVGWVNAELMKNTAEIGQLRLLSALRRG
ncbi:DinB family protein [Micromonospora sp. WMMD1128]|uniref:DinB family protein n=1 Tax=unclassified Micromonospora TaxID=2617518 RepID=UPI00248AD199|nr:MULTISPECIES: DinB family protein [unclassified Micromonospora]WBB71686.1 DinB family protein [Micromonospora sp. WMMD1128]WFE34866.1 DinB family protein [Micromonospora sp. WMMD975]